MGSITYIDTKAYEYQQRIHDEFEKILGEWDMVAEAMCADGISYPINIELMPKGIEREMQRQKYTEDYYMQLSHLLRDRDAAAIGHIVMSNAIAYLQELAQTRAELRP